MVTTKEHKHRIKDELKKAGVTRYGLLKPESRNLSQVIQEDEHIMAVVYGRATTSGGAMLVATDLRVIYFNRMPLFATLDEVTYDLVSGVSKGNGGGLFETITLHTRAGDFTVRFANLRSAERFIKYIEQKCIEKNSEDGVEANFESGTEFSKVFLNSTEEKFLEKHELATLSTIDRRGNVDGAAVYYCTFGDGLLYILTKGGTQKMHNVFAHPQVAVTIYDERSLQTLQIQGIAKIETDSLIKSKVFKQIVRERDYDGEMRLPPVTQLRDESFMVICVQPTVTRFRDYKNFSYQRSLSRGKDTKKAPVY